jgi:RimJ/RimL family protein N-acetyltransferase
MPEGIPIETPRLRLRYFTPEDVDDDYRIASDPVMFRHLPVKSITPKSIKELFDLILKSYEENRPGNIKMLSLAVELKNSRELIGWVAITPSDIDKKEIMLGAGIAKKYWNKGYGTEACRAMMAYCFGRLGIGQLTALVKPQNNASIRMVEKLNMEFVGAVPPGSHENKFFDGIYKYKISKADFNSK